MRVVLICAGLALALAGGTWAQVIDNPRPVPGIGPGLLVLAKDTQGNTVMRYVPVKYLNVEALCAALGGAGIDLRPLHPGARLSQRPARGTGGRLDRGAPLAPFVPSGVRDIVGLRR